MPNLRPGSESRAESENEAAPARRTKAAAPTKQEVAAVLDRLAPIQELESLAPSDITLTLLSGLSIKVSARNKSVVLAFGEIELFDHRTKNPNEQGKALFALAHGIYDRPEDHVIKRMRAIFKKYFGTKSNPFDRHPKKTLNPLFKIYDRTRAADERAKRDARNKHKSYDQSSWEHNQQDQLSAIDDGYSEPSYGEEYPFDDEDDEAGELIRRDKKNSSG